MTRKAVFAAVAFCLSFLLLFAMAEIGLRIWKHDLAFQPDPDLIRSLRPNIDYNVVSYETDDNLNGRSDEIPSQPAVIGTSPTNNLGLRMTVDIEPKRANEKRVLIFGDSYTEAIQVDARDRFSYLADLKLQEATGGEWRIINGAIMNGSPDQYLMMLRKFQETIEPDMVVIVLAPNDTEDGMGWDERYGFVRDEAGAPLHPETQGWLALTRASFVARSFYAILEGRSPAALEFFFPSANPGKGRRQWAHLACITDDRSKDFFRSVTGTTLHNLKEISAGADADFAVMGIHYQYYFPNEPYYEKRFPGQKAMLEKFGCAESRGEKYEAFLWEYMEANAIPFASIYQRFSTAKARDPKRKLWQFYDYHFSAAGHVLAAEELVDLILARIHAMENST